jgi:transcription elongation factor Elf1
MSKIIRFPFAAQTAKGSGHLKFSTPVVVNNQIHLGSWSFTCPRCAAATKFESKNMIFRVIDFYCGSCGILHRVTNPAFTPSPKSK